MTHSPALPWADLFPPDVSYTALSGPLWFRELAAARGQRRVLAAWGQSASTLPDLDGFFGLVGINCPGLSVRRLHDSGFEYVRRFAILPSVSDARWLIPLDSPTVSAAAFDMYTPYRLLARLKRLGVRMAARARLPFWCRDQICIAQRSLPSVERTLSALFPHCPVRLGLSSGTPGPARKTTLAILSADGPILAFAKLGASKASTRLMQHEAEVLLSLSSLTDLARIAPRLLFAGDVDGVYMTVQSPIEGHPLRPRLTPAQRVLLDRLSAGEAKPAAATSLVASFRLRLAALPMPRPDLASILHEVMPILEQLVLPSTIVHGDFAPWNLRERRGIIAAFDWEYAELDGLPLLDELHHLWQVGFLLKGWTVERAYDCLLRFGSSSPLGLSPQQVRALEVVYLLDVLLRRQEEGNADDETMAGRYNQVLSHLTMAQRETVAA